MITVYEELVRRRDALAEAESRAKTLTSQWLWRKQRLDLESIIGSMSAEAAGRAYDQDQLIPDVLVRCGAAKEIGNGL